MRQNWLKNRCEASVDARQTQGYKKDSFDAQQSNLISNPPRLPLKLYQHPFWPALLAPTLWDLLDLAFWPRLHPLFLWGRLEILLLLLHLFSSSDFCCRPKKRKAIDMQGIQTFHWVTSFSRSTCYMMSHMSLSHTSLMVQCHTCHSAAHDTVTRKEISGTDMSQKHSCVMACVERSLGGAYLK